MFFQYYLEITVYTLISLFVKGEKAIFVCLNVTLRDRRTFREKLHLVKSAKTEYSEINWCGNTFYAARISAYKKSAFQKFKNKCRYPVFTSDCASVKNFKYLVTANTVLKIFEGKNTNIALFDKNGNIIHLLPRLVAKCRSVYVYTKKTELYENENNRIFSLIGAAAVISASPLLPRGTTAVITDSNLSFGHIKTFGEFGLFADNCMPILDNGYMLTLPPYTDIYTALTGLLEIGKIKSISHAYCNELTLGTHKFNIKNLP